uniref:hypothetical protein n=1 Tax=Pseudomonas aeruginosa TaxID=287 RepID=UPI0029C85286|nr:hypothetical protein [Pseudomonas aeruginosa]
MNEKPPKPASLGGFAFMAGKARMARPAAAVFRFQAHFRSEIEIVHLETTKPASAGFSLGKYPGFGVFKPGCLGGVDQAELTVALVGRRAA